MEEISNMAGIYKIENLVNGKTYVGSTRNKICYRWYHHKKTLRKNIHRNIRLQRAWNKYGESNFKFERLEEISNPNRELLCQREHYFRTKLNSEYNISPTDIPGTLTNEQRKKLSNSLKERYKGGFSEEHKKKLSVSHKGILSGENNPSFKGCYKFSHPINGVVIYPQYKLCSLFNLDKRMISSICNKKRNKHKNWTCIGKEKT
jgi:group I intron endonuclease